MKFLFIFLILLGIVCVPMALLSCAESNVEAIGLEIAPVSSVSSLTDVLVRVTFQNGGEDTVVIYQWKSRGGRIQAGLGAFLFFDVVKDGRDTLKFNCLGPLPKRPHESDTLQLLPGVTYEETVNLTSFYARGDTEPVSNDFWPKREWLPGEYSISCRYRYSHNPAWHGGRVLWEGELRSNEIVLSVVDPEGNPIVLTGEEVPDYAIRRGLVADSVTAIRVAEAVWHSAYGDKVYCYRPFIAVLVDDLVWEVRGTSPSGGSAAVPLVEIKKSNCRILKVTFE